LDFEGFRISTTKIEYIEYNFNKIMRKKEHTVQTDGQEITHSVHYLFRINHSSRLTSRKMWFIE